MTVLSQVAFVPLFLASWDAKSYGVWLALQGIMSFTTLVDVAVLNYVNFDFLRAGAEKKSEIEKLLSDCIPFSLAIGTLELIAVYVAVHLGVVHSVYGVGKSVADAAIVDDANQALLMLSAVWIATGSIGGLFSRVLAPFGFYARMAWWNVMQAAVTSALPAIAVALGANLRQAGMVLAATTLLSNLPMFVDIHRHMRRLSIRLQRPHLRHGLLVIGRSMVLFLKMLLEITRQTGIRVVLAPLAGASQMAAFSAMRTVANVAMQGLGTITNPLLPELMRFLRVKDQDRSALTMSTVWAALLLGLIPGVVILQLVAPSAFKIWTLGKLEFDPFLFALISMSILGYALAQPATAIVQGYNLLRVQLWLSAITAVVMVGGMLAFVPWIGLKAAAAVLLVAEFANLTGFVFAARRVLASLGLQWPQRTFQWAAASVACACALLATISLIPAAKVWVIVPSVAVWLVLDVLFVRSLPAMTNSRLERYLKPLRDRAG